MPLAYTRLKAHPERMLPELAEPVEVLRPSEPDRSPLRAQAIVQSCMASIEDVTLDITMHDVIKRLLPNGNHQYFEVTSRSVLCDSNGPHHMELRIREIALGTD